MNEIIAPLFILKNKTPNNPEVSRRPATSVVCRFKLSTQVAAEWVQQTSFNSMEEAFCAL